MTDEATIADVPPRLLTAYRRLAASMEAVRDAGGDPWDFSHMEGDKAFIRCRRVVDPVGRTLLDSINVARQRNEFSLRDPSWIWQEHPSVEKGDMEPLGDGGWSMTKTWGMRSKRATSPFWEDNHDAR